MDSHTSKDYCYPPMKTTIRSGLLASGLLGLALIPACVHPAGTSGQSGKTDIPMLVASGKTAAWPLRSVRFDENGKPSYSLLWKNPSRLESHYRFGVIASPKPPEVPKTYQPDGYSPQQKPIDFSHEIQIPAIGRKVVFYCDSSGGGSENATFSTLPIAWPDGHGGTVYYVIWAESDEPQKILSQVKWAEPGSMAAAKAAED